MDHDGYPDEQELQRIREWSLEDLAGLLQFVYGIWWASDWGWHQRERIFRVSTGGWSGNESIIGALQDNQMFWMLCWQESRRGGHYVFEIPKALK